MTRIYEPLAYSDAPIAQSYWRATTPTIPEHAPLEGHQTSEIAIIGAGYTGLNAALALVEAGRDVTLLEANQPGWGASGRNGGFCCLGGSKASPAKLLRLLGEEGRLDYYHAERAAVEHVAELLDTHGIEADTHSNGETQLAHREADISGLIDEADLLRAVHGIEATFHSRNALREQGMASPEFHGALTVPIGFALNSMKYALGLSEAAQHIGARIFGASPVTGITRENGQHVLRTEHGTLSAKTLIIATNGYSSETLPRWLGARYLPVQSSIVVTRPLSNDELRAQGWISRQMCHDTRHLLHYFRLLPDNRMLFGQRGATRTTQAGEAKMQARARADFNRIFPAWREVEFTHHWSGLLAMARRLMPFAGPVPGMEATYAALCYHGNGVAMGSYAGRLLAAQILGQGPATPAGLLAPLKRFELGRWRRALLPAIYAAYGWQDRG